ncbi:MAG: alpha/beta hydrolase [Mobilicoccus sp.]|nr:alpha/beta hydrolase [Mobilicoccus sp.]
MKRLAWVVTYVLVFAVSFAAGALVPPLLSGQSGPFRPVAWDDSVGSVETDLTYGDGPRNRYDLYLPSDRERGTKMVVYLHAGGFTSGDKSDDEDIAKYFTSLGYVTATINYPLSSDENPVSVVDMSQAIAEGVTAAVSSAQSRGYDVDGLAMGGGSAGGALAMIYAYRDAHQAPVPVEAVIQMVGPASFDPAAWFGLTDGYSSDESAASGAEFVSVISGAPVTPQMMRSGAYRDALAPVSAIDLVTEQAPPTLAAYGALDKVAPYAASAELAPALAAHGVPHDVLVFPNSGHGLNRDSDMSDKLHGLIEEYLTRYVPLGDVSASRVANTS